MNASALANLLFVVILLLVVLAARWVQAHRIRFLSEGSVALLLGFLGGGAICATYYGIYLRPLPAHWLSFDDGLIFQVLLPPIIFYAGFSLKKKLFFQNLATIITFGFWGTLATASTVTVVALAGLQLVGLGEHAKASTALAIGTICSCSDTVGILQAVDRRSYPVLYSLVFGEGILNDAVAIVLLGAVTQLAKQHSSSPGAHLQPASQSNPHPSTTLEAVHVFPAATSSAQLLNPVSPGWPAAAAGSRQGLTGAGSKGGDAAAAAAAAVIQVYPQPRRLAGTTPHSSTPGGPSSSYLHLGAATSAAPAVVDNPGSDAQVGLGARSAAPGVGEDPSSDAQVGLGDVVQLMVDFVWLGLSSAGLGVGAGLLSALLMKRVVTHTGHDCDREVLLLGLLGFSAYLGAAAADLSAVLAVFFAAVTMAHYTWHSMSVAGRSLALHSFRVLSGLAEVVLYTYCGMDIWTIVLLQQERTWASSVARAAGLALVLLVAIAVARIAFVLPASAAANVLWRRLHTLSPGDIAVVAWAGLTRGAITLALGYHYFLMEEGDGRTPSADTQVILLALVLLALISTTVLGACNGPVIEFFLRNRKVRPEHRTPKEDLQQGLEPDSDALQLQDDIANKRLSPVAAPAAAAALVALAAEEGLDRASLDRLCSLLSGVPHEGAGPVHALRDTTSFGSNQGWAAGASGPVLSGPAGVCAPGLQPAATTPGGPGAPRAAASTAVSVEVAVEAVCDTPTSILQPPRPQLQHMGRSSSLHDWLATVTDRSYSLNGEAVPLLPPRAPGEVVAWLRQLAHSRPATGGSSGGGLQESLLPQGADGPSGALGDPANEQERSGLHRLWQQVDRRWLQPWFGGRHTQGRARQHGR